MMAWGSHYSKEAKSTGRDLMRNIMTSFNLIDLQWNSIAMATPGTWHGGGGGGNKEEETMINDLHETILLIRGKVLTGNRVSPKLRKKVINLFEKLIPDWKLKDIEFTEASNHITAEFSPSTEKAFIPVGYNKIEDGVETSHPRSTSRIIDGLIHEGCENYAINVLKQPSFKTGDPIAQDFAVLMQIKYSHISRVDIDKPDFKRRITNNYYIEKGLNLSTYKTRPGGKDLYGDLRDIESDSAMGYIGELKKFNKKYKKD